jgi:hypothetical protein
MFEQFQAYIDAIQQALVFGMSLTLVVTTIVQAIKRRVVLPGETPRYLAVGLGTVVGSLFLLYGGAFDPPTAWSGFILPITAAFVWSFVSPEFYELLKTSASRGTAKAIYEVEEAATLAMGEPPAEPTTYDHSTQG